MGLALFSVLVAMTFQKIGTLSSSCSSRRSRSRGRCSPERTPCRKRPTNSPRSSAENEHQALPRLADRPAEPRAVPASTRRGDRGRARAGRAHRGDADGPRSLQGGQRHARAPLRRPAAAGDRPTAVDRAARRRHRWPASAATSSACCCPTFPRTRSRPRSPTRLLEELAASRSRSRGLPLDVSGSLGIAVFPTQSRTRSRCCAGPTSRCTPRRKRGVATRCYSPDMDQHNPSRLTLVEPGATRARARRVRDALPAEGASLRRPRRRRRGACPMEPSRAGSVAPDEFIPLVEKTVLLGPLTFYVMEHVMRQWRVWADEGMAIPIGDQPLASEPARSPAAGETVRAMLERFDDAAAVPAARAHGELPDVGLRALERRARRAGGRRRLALDRRLRHRATPRSAT